MKRNLLTLTLMCLCIVALAQENRISVSGGYVSAGVEDVDENATGYRLNLVYEFNPGTSSFAHGFALGYIGTSADYTEAGESNHKANSFPIYYAPKFSIGKGNLKGFLKGALGTHITGYSRMGAIGEISSTDMGFYGGLGAGASLNLGEKLFISAEYEWAYMGNYYARDAFVNSVMGGIGIRF